MDRVVCVSTSVSVLALLWPISHVEIHTGFVRARSENEGG